MVRFCDVWNPFAYVRSEDIDICNDVYPATIVVSLRKYGLWLIHVVGFGEQIVLVPLMVKLHLEKQNIDCISTMMTIRTNILKIIIFIDWNI